MAANLEISIEILRGEDFSKQFQFLESDGTTPIDLTAYTVYSELRAGKSQTSGKILTFTVAKVDLTGTVTISATDTVTGAITKDSGYYDILFVDGSSLKKYWAGGQATITGTVTKGA